MTASCCPHCKSLAARVDALEQNQRDSLSVMKLIAGHLGLPAELLKPRAPESEPECGVLIQFPVSAS